MICTGACHITEREQSFIDEILSEPYSGVDDDILIEGWELPPEVTIREATTSHS